MKNIRVKLLNFTPSDIIVKAVGMPYGLKHPTIEIATNVIARLNHTSVSEHCVMSFKIDGISRLNMQELMRHRISSTTARSSRFTLVKLLKEYGQIKDINKMDDENIFDGVLSENFVTPKRPDYITDDYMWEQFVDVLKYENKRCLYYMNYFKQQGFKADILKYFLDENFRISLVWTINLRSLINFLNLRLDNKAHFEIRHLAGLIKSQACRVPYIRKILKIIEHNQNEGEQ